MPKVTEAYLADKRNYILECTGAILNEKALYSITMHDIIKKAGFSHGIIYHYYANLDEIFVDYINKYTTENILEKSIDEVLKSKRNAKVILTECIIALGSYIERLLTSEVGRTCFELTVLYAYDADKRSMIYPKLKFKQSLNYAQDKIVEYIVNNIDKKLFYAKIPIPSILMFINSFIDGLAQCVTSAKDNDIATDVSAMFQILASTMVGFFEIQEVKNMNQ